MLTWAQRFLIKNPEQHPPQCFANEKPPSKNTRALVFELVSTTKVLRDELDERCDDHKNIFVGGSLLTV